MIDDRTSKVRKRAENIFNRYGLSIPVDFSKVLTERHIELKYLSNPLDIDAYCELNNKHPTIVLNSEQTNNERLRFSIAHELGHICIPWHTGIDACSLDNPYYYFQGQKMINSQEIEANTFASELLMPSKWVRNKMSEIPDFAALVEAISDEAHTSVLAGFYAINYVLSNGDVFIIKNEQWEIYKVFSGSNRNSVFVPYIKLLPFWELTCIWQKKSAIRSYEIWQFKLYSPPNYSNIDDYYQQCNQNFTVLLNNLSDGKPIRLLPYLDEIVKAIDDQLSIVVYLENVLYKSFCTDKSNIRLPYNEDEFEGELERLKSDFDCHDTIAFSKDSFLFWVRDTWKGNVPKSNNVDSKLILKSIVNESYPDDPQSMLWSINGVMGNLNREHPNASYEELCHYARMRFEGTTKYEQFVAHPSYLDYISSKVLSLLKKRKLR